jgi:hypothetical protein
LLADFHTQLFNLLAKALFYAYLTRDAK